VTSYPYYPFWKVQEPYYRKRFWYSSENFPAGAGNLKVYRCPQYVPSQPSGLKRILLDISFLLSASFALCSLLLTRKFDFIITVAPSFQVGFLGVMYKKIRKATLVYHVQDMQIEAARDLNMIKSPKLINFLFKMERFIFRQADVVSSISDGMVRNIQEKAGKDVTLFPNWTDTKVFYPLGDRGSALRKELGYSETDRIVLYSGSIGEKQGLDAILHAANALRDVPRLKFIICGSGPYKAVLQQLADELKVDNVQFLPIQPFEKFNLFLNMADLHLIIQKAGASDLVMPSKLTTMLSVGGLVLITANEGTGLHDVVEKHDIGILVPAENQTALNEGIRDAIQGNYSHLRQKARKYAEDYLAINKIMQNFARAIGLPVQQAVEQKPPSVTADIVNGKKVSLAGNEKHVVAGRP
jgi:colanic acid biosynthesis glycosyl transferase WcaI